MFLMPSLVQCGLWLSGYVGRWVLGSQGLRVIESSGCWVVGSLGLWLSGSLGLCRVSRPSGSRSSGKLRNEAKSKLTKK